MRKSHVFVCISILLSVSVKSQTPFNPDFIDCVVSLEKEDSLGMIVPHGTGFCIYNYRKPDRIVVATNEHVLRNGYIYIKCPVRDSAILFLKKYGIDTINYVGSNWIFDGHNIETKVILQKDVNFIKHETLDIAVFEVPMFPPLKIGLDSVKVIRTTTIPLSMIKNKANVGLGLGVYFVGFPFGIGHSMGVAIPEAFMDERLNPVIRRGIVAWKSETNKTFLLDAFSYTGNSGSPIFSEANIFGAQPSLIGIVFGHLGEGQFVNFGLARCLWSDDILELIKKFKN